MSGLLGSYVICLFHFPYEKKHWLIFHFAEYYSVDICEEKFLAYFWWCFDRLKASFLSMFCFPTPILFREPELELCMGYFVTCIYVLRILVIRKRLLRIYQCLVIFASLHCLPSRYLQQSRFDVCPFTFDDKLLPFKSYSELARDINKLE